MNNFIIIFVFLLIGVVLRKIKTIPVEMGNSLNIFVIYVSLPAVILLKIPVLELSADILIAAILPWVMLIISSVSVLILSTLLKFERKITGSLLLVIPLGNTSFFGIPMVEVFFGKHAVPYAVLYDQLGSFLALATYGSFILAVYGNTENVVTTKNILKRIISFPPFLALVTAFLLKPFNYPAFFEIILETLSSTLIPLVMVAVGFQLTFSLKEKMLSPIVTGLTIKLLAAPLIALFLCRLAGLNSTVADVSIFEAGMPPMVSAGALAIIADLSPALTAALVGIGIIVSFATLPLIFQLI